MAPRTDPRVAAMPVTTINGGFQPIGYSSATLPRRGLPLSRLKFCGVGLSN